MSHDDFYAHAARYDALFGGWRDLEQDARFLTNLFEVWRPDAPGHAALELAAGPAAHARCFARLGWRAHALDLNESMLDYARAREPRVHTHLDDMTHFTWHDERVDLAMCLLDSLSYILDHDALIAHLSCVADALTSRGLYVMEVVHPRGPLGGAPTTDTSWTVEHEGEELAITFGLPEDAFDPVTQIKQTTVHMVARHEGRVVSQTSARAPLKLWLVQELLALIRHSPFECVSMRGALREDVLIDASDGLAHHAVLVLQKRAPQHS